MAHREIGPAGPGGMSGNYGRGGGGQGGGGGASRRPSGRPRGRGSETPFGVFCGDLSVEVTEDDLLQTFSQFGPIQSARIIRYPPDYVISKGYGFVYFQSEDVRQNVIAMHRKLEIKGNVVALQMGRRKNDTGGGGQGAAPAANPYGALQAQPQYYQDPNTGQLYAAPQMPYAAAAPMPAAPYGQPAPVQYDPNSYYQQPQVVQPQAVQGVQPQGVQGVQPHQQGLQPQAPAAPQAAAPAYQPVANAPPAYQPVANAAPGGPVPPQQPGQPISAQKQQQPRYSPY